MKDTSQNTWKQTKTHAASVNLSYPIKGAWRYRVGDYRLVCAIQEKKLVVLVLKVGHSGDIYD